jgi:hypothetical protein
MLVVAFSLGLGESGYTQTITWMGPATLYGNVSKWVISIISI